MCSLVTQSTTRGIAHYQCQTDTDPSGHLCILADIHVRARTTSRTHYIRVKVDPGADANLMPLHQFRTIFPYLCDKNGKPKEGVLEKTESSFEWYSGDNVSVIRQTKIYAQNKQTQQFMITRIFVIARERSHPLGQCSMPMARIDRRASREQGTSCGEGLWQLLPEKKLNAERWKHTPFRKLVMVLK